MRAFLVEYLISIILGFLAALVEILDAPHRAAIAIQG